jgi:hypothetical protein
MGPWNGTPVTTTRLLLLFLMLFLHVASSYDYT